MSYDISKLSVIDNNIVPRFPKTNLSKNVVKHSSRGSSHIVFVQDKNFTAKN